MKRIYVSVDFGQTIADLGVTHINTDHVRLRQVVTNLISNAVRFTANSSKRQIVVRYDIARLPPEEGTCAVPLVDEPPSANRRVENGDMEVDARAHPLEEGTPLWLFISVTDTGPGLTAHERDILFQRFTRE